MTISKNRPPQAKRYREEAWTLVAQFCTTATLQRQAVAALEFKCRILWQTLDAVMNADEASFPVLFHQLIN